MKKPSFLSRLTGQTEDYEDEFMLEDDFESNEIDTGFSDANESDWHNDGTSEAEEEEDGELPIDMYHTGDNIVIRALIAGVDPDELDISITRDIVTLRGSRGEIQEAPDEDYFHRELFWGNFSRTILLPEEILIDESDAQVRHGLLEITLPKVDKDRSTKLRVKIGK